MFTYVGIDTFYIKVVIFLTSLSSSYGIDAVLFLRSGNLTYYIPNGIADDRFSVDPHTGVVSVRAPLDRETRDGYMVPVYVTSPPLRPGSPQTDVTTVAIKVIDVNDHAPEFKSGTSYAVTVPENSDFAVIHTVVASDLDTGPNGEVTYSITGE
jgi:protocadherin-16/23